jgi:hypothetical protein
MLTRALVTSVLVVFAGGVHADSLGEAAAREKARRAKIGGTSRTFTDDDLQETSNKRAKEGIPSSSAGAPSPAASPRPDSSPGTAAGSNADPPNDSESEQAAKRTRGAEYKVRLAEANAALQSAEEELQVAEKRWEMVDKHTPGLLEGDRVVAEVARKKVERLRQARNEIEDAARREGIPPGYLR